MFVKNWGGVKTLIKFGGCPKVCYWIYICDNKNCQIWICDSHIPLCIKQTATVKKKGRDGINVEFKKTKNTWTAEIFAKFF